MCAPVSPLSILLESSPIKILYYVNGHWWGYVMFDYRQQEGKVKVKVGHCHPALLCLIHDVIDT